MDQIRILLVDDHSAFLKSAANFLRRFDELDVVGSATGGEEGLEKARQLGPDVVLVDLNMPGMSGLELMPLLRASLPVAGLIALTLSDGDLSRKAALKAGADDFVSKSRLLDDLVPTIHKVVTAHATP